MILSVERRWLPNQSRANGGDWVLDFTVDDTSDVSALPVIGQEYADMIVDGRPVVLSGGSSAFIVNASTLHILGSSGWRAV